MVCDLFMELNQVPSIFNINNRTLSYAIPDIFRSTIVASQNMSGMALGHNAIYVSGSKYLWNYHTVIQFNYR